MSPGCCHSWTRSPRIRGLRGRPRHRPLKLFADRGIARRGVAHSPGLGKTRWADRTDLPLAAPLQAPADPLRDIRGPPSLTQLARRTTYPEEAPNLIPK